MLEVFIANGDGSFNRRWQVDDGAFHGDKTNLFTGYQPLFSFSEGALLKGSDGKVYLIQQAHRRWVPDPETFNAIGLDWNAIQNIGDGDLSDIPLGFPLPSRKNGALVQGSGPEVYWMENGYRRHVPNTETFNAMGLDWNAIQRISDTDLNDIPEGAALPPVNVWQNPLDPGTYTIFSGGEYGSRGGKHYGIDLSTWHSNPYVPVKVARSGTVAQVGYHPNGWGNFVRIRHGNEFQTVYAHLSQVNVSQGQTVSAGQKIGNVGSTGNSSGPHLHFETYVSPFRWPTDTRNPRNYIQF